MPLFRHALATPVPADLAVVEGVMGLYDGAAGRGEFSSTAHVARLLDAPVLLVVDVTAMGRSAAALVSGFARFDRRVRIGGVVLNRVGSDRHEMILREALAEIGMPVLGALRRHEALATPSRHLGLVPAAGRSVRWSPRRWISRRCIGSRARRRRYRPARPGTRPSKSVPRWSRTLRRMRWRLIHRRQVVTEKVGGRWSRWPAGRRSRSPTPRPPNC